NQLPEDSDPLVEHIYNKSIAVNDVEKTNSFDDMTNSLLSGSTIIMIDGVACAMTVETIGGEQRAIEEPVSETLIRGPRTGLVENIQTNIAIISKRTMTYI